MRSLKMPSPKLIRLLSRPFRLKVDEELARVEEMSVTPPSASSSSSTTSSSTSVDSWSSPLTEPRPVLECASPSFHKSQSVNALVHECVPACSTLAEDDLDACYSADTMARLLPLPPTAVSVSASLPRSAALPIHRRSSDSDLSITPKGTRFDFNLVFLWGVFFSGEFDWK